MASAASLSLEEFPDAQRCVEIRQRLYDSTLANQAANRTPWIKRSRAA
jgi:hypothetical protein